MHVNNKQPEPDLLLINANIITLDPHKPKADWTAISDGKIFSLGASKELTALNLNKVKIIDCIGKTVIPGFIDSHLHLLSFAESLVTLNLKPDSGICSIPDIKSRIQSLSRDLSPGAWIRGKGYNEFYLNEKRHPNRWDLDEAAPNHPVKLSHRSGHAHVLNSLALKLTGINMETPDPPGGIIERDINTGMPTGLLYEMGDFLSLRIPALNTEEIEKGIRLADQELISCGITSIQDASSGNDLERCNLFKSWEERGMIHPRLNIMLGIKNFIESEVGNLFHLKNNLHKNVFAQRMEGIPPPLAPPLLAGKVPIYPPLYEQLQKNCIKIILDKTTGRLNPAQEELDELVLKIHESGMQAAIHAIEEDAIESACYAIEKALKRIPVPDHRHRIEHCSICPPSLARYIASLGISVVTQPAFIFYNGDRYLETVEPGQLNHLYPFASLIKAGVRLAGSSDCPIAPVNPLLALYAAVSRMSESRKKINQNECIQPIDALKMYTEYAAEITFSEGSKGSISPNKLADLVVLNGDPLSLPADEIKDIKVVMTIINGKVVWDNQFMSSYQ